MAIFTAVDSGSDMMLLFSWVDGSTPIDSIELLGVDTAHVRDEPPGGGMYVKYTGADFANSGTTPTGGTFTTAEIWIYEGGLAGRGLLSGITGSDNFAEIVTEEAYRILDGDDFLNGGLGIDVLFGGYAGSDTYTGGGGGGDTFLVAAGTTPVAISGTQNLTDTITVVENLNGQEVLNLRETALSSINQFVINDGLVVQLNSSQIGAGVGVSPNASILGVFGAGLLVISMNTGALNLAGFTVMGGVEVSILGTNAGEAITGTNGKDILTPGNGNDTVNGLGGNDIFNVIGTDSQFDAFNGGSGSDKIKIFGATAFTLNGFNAASQAIEVWEGNGQGLVGNGNANVFNLAGLTTKTGLTAISGLGGNDTIVGSKFADTIAASGTEAQFDTMNGRLGTDTFRADGSGPLTLNGFNATSQSIEAWAGNGQSLFGNGDANVFNLAGLTSMTGLPFVEGLAGNDTLTGSKFVDHLLGGDGNDGMNGGDGDDELEGGLGVDTMTGGVGGDRFDFDAVVEIGKKKGLLDLITDWGDGDTIDLSSIDANGAKNGDKAFKFLKKESADFTKAGQVGFDQKKGVTYVQGDTNGDGKADFKLQVTGKIDFEKADFVL